MKVDSILSSVPADEPYNDRVFVCQDKRYPAVPVNPYEGYHEGHHVVRIQLTPGQDDFHLTFEDTCLPPSQIKAQLEIVVCVTGHITGYTNKSKFPSPFPLGLPRTCLRESIVVRVAHNQRLRVSAHPEWYSQRAL